MWTAITRKPAMCRSSRHCATRGRFSLQMPQLTDQKCTSVGRPLISASACACVAPNHSVAPSKDGISVPILIGITLPRDRQRLTGDRMKTFYLSPVTCHSSQLLSSNRFLSRLPFGLTEAAGLKGLDDAQRLFSRTTDVQIMNHLVAQHAFGINHEKSAQRNPFVFDEHAVVARHCLGRIRRERIFEIGDAA